LKTVAYKKAAWKRLVKLKPLVNFTNNFRTVFFHKELQMQTSKIQKTVSSKKKAACKMLEKLRPFRRRNQPSDPLLQVEPIPTISFRN